MWGEVPEGWNQSSLAALGSGDRPAVKAGPFGSALKKEYYTDRGYRVYGQEQVLAGSLSVGNYYIDEERFAGLKTCEVLPGDILVSLVGTVGRSLVVPLDAEPGIINPRLVRLSPDPNIADSHFLAFWLEAPQTRQTLSSNSQRGTMDVLNSGTLSKIPLFLPPLPEQRKIAAILSSVDESIRATQAVIEQTRRVKEGLLQELLTRGIGHARFKQTDIGEIPQDWEVRKLEKAVDQTRPITYGIVQTGPNIADGIPCVRVVDIVRGDVVVDDMIRTTAEISQAYRRTILRAGDLMLALRGEIGLVRRVEENLVGSNLTRGVALIAPGKDYDSEFLKWAIMSPAVRDGLLQRVNGSALKEIPLSGLRQVLVPLPPLHEQRKIAAILSSMDEAITLGLSRSNQLKSIKAGLLQDLLTGKVRVSL